MEDLIITLDIDGIKDIDAESIKQMIANSTAEVLIVNWKSNQDRAIILDSTEKETPVMKIYLVSPALAQNLAQTPSEKELDDNNRSRSSKLRVIERIKWKRKSI